VKARSASLNLFHFVPGRHRDLRRWHDQDHRPEVLGGMPEIFISQRWVAPPEFVAARPHGGLPHVGGEYVNLYWSSGLAEDIDPGFAVLRRRLEPAGRMAMMEYIDIVWNGRLEPVAATTRAGLDLSIEAVLCAPQTTGLIVLIDELARSADGPSFARWLDSEHTPRVLDTQLFMGAVRLATVVPAGDKAMVTFLYSERPDPLATFNAFLQFEAELIASGALFPQFTRIHAGMYLPGPGLDATYD
jgi:hypothetical protein